MHKLLLFCILIFTNITYSQTLPTKSSISTYLGYYSFLDENIDYKDLPFYLLSSPIKNDYTLNINKDNYYKGWIINHDFIGIDPILLINREMDIDINESIWILSFKIKRLNSVNGCINHIRTFYIHSKDLIKRTHINGSYSDSKHCFIDDTIFRTNSYPMNDEIYTIFDYDNKSFIETESITNITNELKINQ